MLTDDNVVIDDSLGEEEAEVNVVVVVVVVKVDALCSRGDDGRGCSEMFVLLATTVVGSATMGGTMALADKAMTSAATLAASLLLGEVVPTPLADTGATAEGTCCCWRRWSQSIVVEDAAAACCREEK